MYRPRTSSRCVDNAFDLIGDNVGGSSAGSGDPGHEPPQESSNRLGSISVVTVVRNDLPGLRRTFQSLAAQTSSSIQHIVIDGASSDGSAEWARRHTVFANTIVISEPDAGIFDAMNKGLSHADGEIVYYLNSGDCIASPDVLEFVSESYKLMGWTWAIGRSQMVDPLFRPTRRPSPTSYSWWRKTFWQYDISHQSVFIETPVLKELGGFDPRFTVSADCHMVTRVGKCCRPTILPWTVALTLEGGVSGESMLRTHWQFHKARVDILEMKAPLRTLDAAWTAILVAKTRVRGAARLVLRAARPAIPG